MSATLLSDISLVNEKIKSLVNLSSARLGGEVIAVSDDFFADKSRLLLDKEPEFIPDLYDENGKWMDGWESRRRRRRHGGHDHAIIKLSHPGILEYINIDTSHFTGNYPPKASLQGCLSSTPPNDNSEWVNIIATTDLKGDSHHWFSIDGISKVNYLRLNIFPDGGVARLRCYGKVAFTPDAKMKDKKLEVSALEYGGRIVGYNDAHYGNVAAILSPGRGKDMGDGWETRRRRIPGNDWLVIALSHPAIIMGVEIDTAHYKGNYPDKTSLQASLLLNGGDDLRDKVALEESSKWPELLTPQSLKADFVHSFDNEFVKIDAPVNYIRLNIFPDGGVSRLRLWGYFEDAENK